jgi:uncharacterized protein
MLIEEMTHAECAAMLARANVARLACAVDNQPYVVPVHIDSADGFVYSFSMIGQKIQWMRLNPLVCLEIEEFAGPKQWATLVVSGQYEELPDEPEYTYQRGVAERLFGRRPTWWEPASVPLAGHPSRSPILFRILVVRMSGRRAGAEVSDISRYSDERVESTKSGRLGRVLGRLFRRQST